MFALGLIEECLESKQVLEVLKPYFISQRIENVPEDTCPVWHTNEYHIDAVHMPDILELLKNNIKPTWYIHAFNEEILYVVLRGKWFTLPLYKDSTWEEMIAYGVDTAQVERRYLENIPLHV